MGKIILASSSPRRQEILKRIGLSFKTVNPDLDEVIDQEMPPEDIVSHWSRKKAEAVAAHYGSEDIVIAADTIVYFDGNILGKPTDETDAFKTLTMLSGSWHTVYTGITIIRGDDVLTDVESTTVLFRELSSKQIEHYIDTGEPMDKAGSYGIQDLGALFVERIDGDIYNVIGLPLYRLSLMLSHFGIDLLSLER